MTPLQHQAPTKEDEGGGKEEKIQVEGIKAKEWNNISCQNNLELRLGVSSSNSSSIHDPKSINGLEPWLFSDPPTWFIDPWSLAARQQKAVLEQAHKKTTNFPSSTSLSQDLPREIQPPSSSIVGWPPVCAFRRNMVFSQGTRPEIEEERKAKRAKVGEEEAFNALAEEAKRSAMFVKVNMDGYAVGRKIDLKAHSTYDSLSHSLKKMFKNFLSLDYPISEEHIEETLNRDYLLLYEDHEGDRMLVGDVPWEMFLSSVRRLFIVRCPKSQRPAEVHVSSPANMDAKEYQD